MKDGAASLNRIEILTANRVYSEGCVELSEVAGYRRSILNIDQCLRWGDIAEANGYWVRLWSIRTLESRALGLWWYYTTKDKPVY